MAGAIRTGHATALVSGDRWAQNHICVEGKVNGAIENFVPLPKNTQATGSQLHQIGLGHQSISDWSDEKEVQRWLKADKVEEERKMAILPKVDSSGYPRLEARSGFQYIRLTN
jgi:hypothetical protein